MVKEGQLTQKQQRFVELYANPSSDTFGHITNSYIAAGYKTAGRKQILMQAASRLVNTCKIQSAIKVYKESLQAKEAKSREVTKDYLTDQLITLYEQCKGKDNTNALRALENLGKTIGAFIDRKEIDQTNHEVPNLSPQELEAIQALARANNIRLSQKQG